MGSGAPVPMSQVRTGPRPPRWQLRHGGNRLVPPPPTASTAKGGNVGVAVRCGAGGGRAPANPRAQRPATSHGGERRRRSIGNSEPSSPSRKLGGLSERLVIDHGAAPGNEGGDNGGGGAPILGKYTMVRSANAAMPSASVGSTAGERRQVLHHTVKHQQQESQQLPAPQRTRRPSTAGPSAGAVRTATANNNNAHSGGGRGDSSPVRTPPPPPHHHSIGRGHLSLGSVWFTEASAASAAALRITHRVARSLQCAPAVCNR